MNALPIKGCLPLTPTVAPGRRKVILVVDDHEDTRDLLRYVFEAHGYLVIEALDGEEAVYVAENDRPDIVIMDTTLRGIDGLEATRRIRATSSICRVPIVFLSGHAQATARDAAFASGADDYLIKPVCLDELEMCVETQLIRANGIEP